VQRQVTNSCGYYGNLQGYPRGGTLLQINRRNLKYAGTIMLLVLLIGVADSLIVLFARRPFPWVVLVSAIFPVLVAIFVILPMTKDEKPTPPSV
jgi:hypothetical protein